MTVTTIGARPGRLWIAAALVVAACTAAPRDEPPVRVRATDRLPVAPATREAPAVRARLEHRPDEPDDDIQPCPPPIDAPHDLRPTAGPGAAASGGGSPTRPGTRG